MKKSDRLLKWILLTPVIIYSIVLILLPIIYIVSISFLKHDIYGGIVTKFTLENYINIFNAVYVKVFLKSFLIAIISTAICILISYPFVIFVNQKKPITQNVLMTLVIVPFLTNSLIRMYGWIILLRKNGIINTVLVDLNLINHPLSLMYNEDRKSVV